MPNTLRLFSEVVSPTGVTGLRNPAQWSKYNRRDVCQVFQTGDIPGITDTAAFRSPTAYTWKFTLNVNYAITHGIALGPSSCNRYGGQSVAVRFFTSGNSNPAPVYFRGYYTTSPVINAVSIGQLNQTVEELYRIVPDRGTVINKNTSSIRHPGMPIILDTPLNNVTKVEIYVAPGPGHNLFGQTAPIQFAYGGILASPYDYLTNGSLDEILQYSPSSSISRTNSVKISEICGVSDLSSPGRSKNKYDLKLSLVSGQAVKRLNSVMVSNGLIYANMNPWSPGEDNQATLREQINSQFCRILSPLNVTNVFGDYYNVDLKMEEL